MTLNKQCNYILAWSVSKDHQIKTILQTVSCITFFKTILLLPRKIVESSLALLLSLFPGIPIRYLIKFVENWNDIVCNFGIFTWETEITSKLPE